MVNTIMTTFKEPANILLVDDDSRNLDVLDSILACPEYRRRTKYGMTVSP